MRIELNIGLNVTGGSNNSTAFFARHSIAMRALDNMLRGSRNSERHMHIVLGEHVGADGATPTEEVTLVAALVVDTMAFPHEPLAVAVHALAVALEQDCIAVYFPELGFGKLIGPRAGQWGEFNLDYFVRY